MTTWTYDALDRVHQITDNDGGVITYTYDARDRVARIDDTVSGWIERTYDDFDRLTSESTPRGSVGYTYDAAGRRKTMTVTGQTVVDYEYDNADRLTEVRRGAMVVGMTYDNANRRSTVTLPNGIVAEYGYDDSNQITGIRHVYGAATIGEITYAYDAAGRRTEIGGTWARTGLPAAIGSAAHDAADRLLQWGGVTMSYDDNGNLASDGLTSYVWNARNHLVGMSGGTSAAFVPDAIGRRSSKTINGTTTQFLFDVRTLLQEQGSGGTPTANLLTGLGLDETFARTDASGTRIPLVDALGSTVELADDSGAVLTHYTYEPYGSTSVSGTFSPNAAQFTGRERDVDGLYYFRARYYGAAIARFLSEDPAESDSPLYAYARSNPVTFLDPLGLKPGDPYSTVDKAAIAALQEFNPKSIEVDREFGGSIYCEGSKYKYTDPNMTLLFSDFVHPSRPPAGKKLAGEYHTHARNGNDGLSGPDKQRADALKVPSYVGTPIGTIVKYDPAVGLPQVIIGRTRVPKIK